VLKFLRLPVGDQALLVQALALQTIAAVLVRLVPLNRTQELIARRRGDRRWRRHRQTRTPEQVALALERTRRFVPFGATCLVQALAGRVLLERSGRPATLTIGVRRDQHDRLEAHAWLECGGTILIGASERDGYAPLTQV
jgi:hypothetical protein